MLLPNVADRRDFTSAVVIHKPHGKTKTWLVFVITHFIQVTLLNSECKLSDALYKVGCGMRLQFASLLGLALPGSHW